MRKFQKGFTLFELALVILIMSFLGTAAVVMIHSIGDVILTEYAINNTNTEGRIGIERMSREIRLIRNANNLTANANSITFTDTNNTAITFSLSGTNLMRNSEILSGDVSALAFTYYDIAGATTATTADIRYIRVELSLAQNDTTTSLETVIYPRALS